MDRAAPSLAARALLAVALMIGFYLLAIGIALVLLYIPYGEWTYAHRVDFRLVLFCLGGAAVILWSIVPRRDRFKPPGPTLTPTDQPALFTVLKEIAAATRQAMPADVYLVPDLNTWVAQRGGVMGVGGRRVMGLGLPVLQVLRVSELRAVLAHEFGHYHGGDTKLGPWIYKTRAALGRTVGGLSRHSSILVRPFLWYGRMFLRVSHAVSRRQEFTADDLAARTMGARPLIDGLKKVHGASMAFGPYWSSEVAPVLGAGFLPPLAEGFRRFVAGEAVARAIAEGVDRAVAEPTLDPYDTHPPLRERIEAVRTLAEGERHGDDPPAIALVSGLENLERALLRGLADERSIRLKPVAWEDVGSLVYHPMWTEAVRRHGACLTGVAVNDLPTRISSLTEALVRSIAAHDDEASTSREERIRRVMWVLAAALACSLVRAGWSIRAVPGEPLSLQGPLGSFEPFDAVSALTATRVDAEAWSRRCADVGILDLTLMGDTAVRVEPRPLATPTGPASPSGGLPPDVQSKATSKPNLIRCWSCKEFIEVTEENRGKTVRCPKCNVKQRMPV